MNDPVLEIIRRTRDDRHFTHFLFEIVLFEFAACTKTHKPMVPLNLTVLLMAWNHARSVLSKFDKLASASKEYSRLAQEVPEDAGGENFMSLFELQVATAPFAYSAADLCRYLNDPFRAPLLVARELTVVDLPGMSEDFFALRALTPADHERYWTFYNNLVSPKFHDRYSAIVLGLRELWKDVGTGGWSVTLIGPSRIKGVEKYSRRYNINRVLKEEGLAPLPPITTSPPKAASSSATASNGKAALANSSTPPPAKIMTPASSSIATTSTTAPTKVPAKAPAKTTTTVATTASKDKNSGRPALVDTQVSRGTPSKPAPYSTTTSSKAASTDYDDDLENNEVFFKFVVHEWKKTLDETNARLTGVRVKAFLDCDFSEKAAKVMENFSVSQLMNICLFADIFNRMLVRRDDALDKGRQRLIREYSARKPDTMKNAAAITTTSTTTTITATSSTALPEVALSTYTTATATATCAYTPSFPNRKIATVRKPKVIPKVAPTVARQATNRSATVATAQTGLKSMQEQEDSDTDSDLPDLLDSDANDDTESDLPDLLDSDDGDDGDDDDSGTDSDLPDLLDSDAGDSGTDSDLPDLLDSDTDDSGTDSDLPDLLDSDNDNLDSGTDDDLPDLLDSEVEVEATKSNDKADESSDWETESDLPDLLDSENEKGQETVDVARKHSDADSDSDLPDLLDSDEPEDSETDSDLPDLLDSEPDDSGSDFDLPDLLDSSDEAEEEEDDDDKDDSDYIFSKSDSETGSESSGSASEDEEKDLYGTKLVDTLSDYLIEANLARNTRVWTEKITLRYLDKAQSGISEQELAASRERELAYLYLCDHRFEDPMNAPDFEDEEYSPSDEGDGKSDVSTEYSDDGEADIDISESEEDALLKDYNNMDEDGTQSVVSYLECERQQETTYEWSEYYERRLQDPEGTVAQAQRERIERTERVVNERAEIAEEQARIAREEAEQERLTREKAEKERIAREKAEQERLAREKAEQERQEKLARERAERERVAREKAEQERLIREKAKQEKLAHEKVEQERIAREKTEEKERIAQEKAENERWTRLRAQIEADQAKIDEKAKHLRREREEAAAQEQKSEQLAQEGQERIGQQARENTERYMQESAEQRAREQLAQQQEFQVRLRQELNAALEQAEKLGPMVVPSGMSDGATSMQLQPTTSAIANGGATLITLTPTLEASPLTDSQERSRMSEDVNEEEDDTRLSAEALEWPVEEAELVGEAVDSAEVNEQRQPRLNESTKWPNGQQIYYNLRGIDFSLALWRSPRLAFNVMEKEIKECSYVTGLGDNNSDVDMCVYSDFFRPQAIHSDVSFLASWLQHECQMFEVNAITDAKVPIVKFVDNMTSIHCDLNVQHPLGIINSELIKNYIDIDERLPVFLMLLKYFAKCHSILDASQGYLCSYALILMGIVFFQEQAKPILPRLQSRFTCPKSGKKKTLGAALSEGLVQPRSVLQAGQRFDCTFDTRLAQYKGYGRSNKKPVAQLLYEFFEFFCRRFDYRTMEVNSQMGQFRERNAVARQKKIQLAEERSAGFKTRHTGSNGFVYDGDRHVWMSAEEQTFIMSQEAAGVVPRSARSYPLDHAPEFQDSPSSSSSNGMNGMYGMNGSSNGIGNGGRYHDRFGSEPFLCVMDPFINNRNVAGTCRGEKLAKVWRSFDHAYKCLAIGDLDGAFCTPTEAKEVWDGLE
ncbi:hypothetical protein BGZ82_003503 [Podila clonocystis]|nr:hypothetical protein BGZ82_003503 [Podila clonocystis]